MKLKQTPEDFKVEELINLPKKNPAGQHTYFWLTKKNYTTVRAIMAIAKALNVSFARFHFAGTKDANAITRQLVSAFQIPQERLAGLHLKDIEIAVVGRFADRLALGDLTGNRFEIVLRDLNKKELNNIKYNYVILNKNGFPNYFGEQRFGGGNSALVGREIVRGYFRDAIYYLLTYSEKENKVASTFRALAKKKFGMWPALLNVCPKFFGIETTVLKHLVQVPTDFAGALRKLPKPTRRMYVHAYQSYLWNAGLAAVKGKPKKEYEIPGYNTKLGTDAFSKKVKELLAADNLTLDSFRCASMPELASEGAGRPALVKAKHFQISEPEKDELNKGKQKITLKFELPKGAYATELIRQLTA
jgi:tRNA pseudouridine13 synthase